MNSLKDIDYQSHPAYIDNINRPISIKDNESMINNLSKYKVPGPDDFTGKSYQISKEEMILYNISLQYFPECRSKETLTNYSALP